MIFALFLSKKISNYLPLRVISYHGGTENTEFKKELAKG
jgi:hypothetical protein